MAKIFWGDVALPSWELDPFNKALLPALCRSAGVSFLEDKEGNFILEPFLGNKTIVLRPLTSPAQGIEVLLATLSQGLHDQGANVLVVPAAASDGQLFRLWQTQVLFAFTQKEAARAEPVLRFFYAPQRRAESLGLIASLVQAMLRSPKPPAYTIPGAWEHWKNFRYRRLLNNAEVPSVLIEFCQASLDEEAASNIATWFINGLILYFQQPPAEETVQKLQSLLQRFREACLLPVNKIQRGDAEALVTARPAHISAATGAQASLTDMARTPVETEPDAKQMLTAAVPDDFRSPAVTAGEAMETANAGTPSQEETMLSAPDGATDAAAGEAAEEVTVTTENEPPFQELQPEAAETAVEVTEAIEAPEEVKSPRQHEFRVKASERDQGPVPTQDKAPLSPQPLPVKAELITAKSPAPGSRATGITAATVGTRNQPVVPASPGKGWNGRPVKRRQRGNPFAPPGDGPVFIFKRPLEATRAPSFFPHEVAERMGPLPIQSTFLAREPGSQQQFYAAMNIYPKSITMEQAPRQEIFKRPPDDQGAIRTAVNATGTVTGENWKTDSPLAELKNLGAAILTPEQAGEPLNSEAPSN